MSARKSSRKILRACAAFAPHAASAMILGDQRISEKARGRRIFDLRTGQVRELERRRLERVGQPLEQPLLKTRPLRLKGIPVGRVHTRRWVALCTSSAWNSFPSASCHPTVSLFTLCRVAHPGETTTRTPKGCPQAAAEGPPGLRSGSRSGWNSESA
jgi:hypothetical protein